MVGGRALSIVSFLRSLDMRIFCRSDTKDVACTDTKIGFRTGKINDVQEATAVEISGRISSFHLCASGWRRLRTAQALRKTDQIPSEIHDMCCANALEIKSRCASVNGPCADDCAMVC